MRIACLQHVPFEQPGHIAAWALDNGHSIAEVHLFDGQPPPKPETFDLLVVMGGPMSVHDEADHPWLVPEKRLIRECLAGNKFLLGVCLGSQLIAEALGSRVYRNRLREIGWFPIRLRPEAADSPYFAGLPAEMQALHWHGETYDLPPGCTHLAESSACAVQAFEHPSALGLQFHLEVTPEGLAGLIANCGHEIGTGPFEQPAAQLTLGQGVHGLAAKSWLYRVLDRIEA
jgi:GMP synthase-like glutamine amidotransferase